MNPWGLLIVAGGLLAICGAAFNWEWFMSSRKAGFFILDRTGTRVFYGLLGSVLAGLGVFLTAGLLAMCVTLGIFGILALQSWMASGKEDLLLSAHVLRGPPDGG